MERVFLVFLLLMISPFGGLGQLPVPSKVEVNGVELHYIEKGSGKPLILLHGGVSDYRLWDLQLDEFAKTYRVISYSRRFSYPNKNPIGPKYRPGVTDAEDLAAFLRKLGLTKVHLVGLSYGALTGLIFAVKNPKMVASIVLAEPPAHQLIRDLPGGENIYQNFIIDIKPVAEAFRQNDDRLALERFNRLMGREAAKQPPASAASPAMQNALALRAINLSPEPFPNIPKGKLRRLKIPTLIITGEKTTKIHSQVDDELARLIPGANRALVPNAGHGTPRENPSFFNTTVLDFLSKLSEPTQANRRPEY